MVNKGGFTFKILNTVNIRKISTNCNINRKAIPLNTLFNTHKRSVFNFSGFFLELGEKIARKIIKNGELSFTGKKLQQLYNLMSPPPVKSKAILESCNSALGASRKVLPNQSWYQKDFLKFSPIFDKQFSLKMAKISNLYGVIGGTTTGALYLYSKWSTAFKLFDSADKAFAALQQFYLEHKSDSPHFKHANFLALEDILLNEYFFEVEKLKSVSFFDSLKSNMGFAEKPKHKLLIDQYIGNHQTLFEEVTFSSAEKKKMVLEKLSLFKPVVVLEIQNDTTLILKKDGPVLTNRQILYDIDHFYLD